MAFKRFIGVLFVSLLLLFSLLCVALYFFLPTYLETKLIPEMAQDAGIGPLSCQIRRLGLAGVDVGQIQVGKGMSVDSVQIDYQLKGLLHRRIQQISIIGVRVGLSVNDGKISIDGVPFSGKSKTTASSKIKTPSEKKLPATTVFLDRLSIKNSVAVCRWNGKKLHIPFELDMVLTDHDQGAYRYLLKTYLRENLIKIAGEIDTADRNATLALEGQRIPLENFSDIFPVLDKLKLKCAADIRASAKVNSQPFNASNLSVALTLHQPELLAGDMVLRSAMTKKARLPVDIKVDTDDLAAWQFSISQASVSLPWGNVFANVEGRIVSEEDSMKIDGKLYAQLKPLAKGGKSGSPFPGLMIEGTPSIAWEFSGQKKKAMPWEVNLVSETETTPEKAMPWKIAWNNLNIQFLPPRIQASASVDETDVTYQISLEVPKVKLTKDKNRIKWSSVTLSAESKRSEKSSTRGYFLSATALNGQIATDTGKGYFPRLSSNWKVTKGEKNALNLNGNLLFSKGAFQLEEEKVHLRGISAKILFQWPYIKKQSSGHLRVASITWDKKKLGAIKGAVFQKNTHLGFKGAYHSQLFKDMVVQISGETDLFSDDMNTQVKIDLPSYQLEPDLALDLFIPDAAGISLSGEVMLESDITVSKYARTGTLVAGFQNGQLKDDAKKLSIDGISINVAMPALFDVKSAPKQLLQIDLLSYGDLFASDMTAEFQIESPRSFFIEQSRFKWCDGYIQTQPLRITPGINDYDVTFYCDRLKLSCLLEQFGAVKATGGGTVNGRVPIKISNKKISFQDGFLYSTPGGGGHIQLTDTEMLTAGIPQNTPQYVQLDIAREALKDYEYKWVKVHLSTEKNNLDLRLQFDGKPGDLLPFVYKKELGRFIRVDATGKGSRFQGISLDVNFKLPLDELLQYKDIMDRLN